MENLYELAALTKNYKSIISALVPDSDNSPLKKLFDIVFSDIILSDHDCMIKIYSKRNITAFSRLKARLKEILHLSLLLQTGPVTDAESVAALVVNNLKNMVVARILTLRRAPHLSIDLLEKTISTSIKYHFTENIITQSRQLLFSFSSVQINKYKFAKYSEIQNQYLKVYDLELKAENYFLDLQRNNLQSLANPTDELIKKAKSYVDELNSFDNIKSPVFIFNKYRIQAFYYEYTKDFKNLLELSEATIKEYGSPSRNSPFVVANLYVRKIWALIQSGQVKEARNFGNSILPKIISGSSLYYRIGHYTLKTHLYLGEYKQSIVLINTLLNNPKYSKIDKYYTELFGTTLGYIYLLVESELVKNLKEDEMKLPEFKLGKFLNTTPLFSKDKRGINVSILLMHIAFLLQRKEYNAIIDRIDSLNQYAYRYLRKDDSFRSNCMIKMVIQMTKADFHPVRTERYTADLLRQLSTVNLAGSGENIEIEIIPFEVLWEIMVKSL